MSLLPRRPQDGFPTWPSVYRLARVEQESVWVHKPDQVGGVEVPLHLQAARRTGMHPKREWFLLYSTTLTGLGQFGRSGRDGDDLPASTCSQTGQDLHEHARSTPLDAPAVAPLPRSVGYLLQEEGAPLAHDLMSEARMQTLAVSSQPALPIRQVCLRLPLAFGRAPVLLAFAPFLHGPVGEVVSRIIGPSLPVQVPLLPPDLGCLRVQLGTQRF
jgi:hypothetical protein